MLRPLLCALAVAFAAGTPLGLRADALTDAQVTAQRMETLRARPDRLAAFLAALPKGGDLHNHADGSVYAENILAWGIADGACYAPDTLALDESCAPGSVQLAASIARDSNLAVSLVRAMSMETFAPGAESGHDHFFNTFGKFGSVAGRHRDRILAAATSDAARAGVSYLELMTAFDSAAARGAGLEAATTHPFDPGNLAADDAALDGLFPAVVRAAIATARTLDAARLTALGCATAVPDPGCGLTVRYIQSVNRLDTPASVFAQTRLAFELASTPGTNVVAINYVAPEDAPVAVRDYALHMRIVAYFHKKYPRAGITLHAGELTPAFASPAALSDHIRTAIEIAGATRIGHGVDVLGERNAPELLREMARKRVLVEIALTSNDVILNVRGKAHPLEAYLAAGVPVALVTDDAGVSRSDFTHEFVRAVTTYGFHYPLLKTLIRNSVHYAFLAGESLWTDESYRVFVPACTGGGTGPACIAYRAANPKAAQEWELERELRGFEHRQASAPPG